MSETRTGPRLTRQQAEALDVDRASVALSAGAGCGKTTVLTERFVRAVGGPEPIALGRVVALTFTNKAARELRDRIRAECRARLESGHGDPDRWRSILRGLEAARIGTFHSFCGEILRRHAIAAGVDPGFAVLDEPIAMAIRDEALNLALRERLADRDPDLIELAVEFGLGIVVKALDELLANRSAGDLPAWAAREPEDVLIEWVATWTETVRPQLLVDFEKKCRPCRDLLASAGLAHPKAIERVARLEDAFALLKTRSESTEAALAAIRELAKMTGLSAKGTWPSDEVKAAVGDHFKKIRDEIDKLLEAFVWDESTSLVAARQGVQFARLVVHARDAYDRAKQRRGGLDNDDLLLLTRRLLAEHPESVRADLNGSIDLMLVDEFQDTDPVQSDILRHLAGPGLGDGRMFLVGDFKQSIYRFRGARPGLFIEYRSEFPAEGRRSLTENFRSVPGILDFVNALFADTFEEADAALQPGGGRPDFEGGPPAVGFLWDPAPAEPKGTTEKADATARRREEARRIAEYLRDRLDAGWTVRGPGGIPRPATAGDVAILFRSLSDASAYETALAEAGLDYHVVGGSGFFAQQEVSDVINLLTAVEDPLDAVAMAGALRSPAFSLSDDSLFWLVQETPGAPHAGLAAARGEWLERLSPPDRPRVERARELLDRWRAIKDRTPIAGLVEMILDESGYEAALLGEALGDRKRANARKLARMARAFDEQGGFTLADFVARLRADMRMATKENQAATTDEAGEIVRLMSIHQAKGLEFPIVVIPDLDRKRPGDLKRVAFDATLGPLVNPVAEAAGPDDAEESGGSLGWTLHRHLERQADDDEALRLLYVATTRARDFLLLSSASDPAKPATSPALRLIDRRFERTTGRFLGQLPDGLVAPRVEVIASDRPDPAQRLLPRRRQPRLLDVARVIRETIAGPCPEPPPRIAPTPPSLDLDPAWGLSSRAGRRDRLLRTILAESRSLDLAALPKVAARAARLQDPVAPASLVAEVLDWLALPAWKAATRDATHSPYVIRGYSWTIAWPFESNPLVLSGTGDYAFDEPGSGMTVIQVSGPGADGPRERLRHLVSAEVARERKPEIPVRLRRVRLGDGAATVEDGPFDPAEIADAIRAIQASGTL
ncbi:UvrD-helicase domain-containing protein [Tundrisphaera sp. TA3]|uniref:UvrD-helicase domain-containing protein n=1 Tax=Tundrisphaera sp. TA3 TaxID=3435775 RepID=UPI003EBFF037